MSLINEALKKVSEAERGKTPKTDFEMRAMQPASYERRTSPLVWIVIPMLILAFGIGGFLLARTSQPSAAPAENPVAKTATPVEQPQIVVFEAEQPAAPVAAASVTAGQPKTQPDPQPAVSPTGTPTPASAAASTGPTYRLKAILYSKNPTALINEAAVQTGGEVDGATVTKIDPTAVTLEYQGKVTILKLGTRQSAN